jgi:Tol biopolymer transport system component
LGAWADTVCAQAALSRTMAAGVPPIEANSLLRDPSVSGAGAHIVFATAATNVSPTFSGALNVYRYTRASGAIEIVSRNSSTGAAADGSCFFPVASTDARFIAFESTATNLGPSGSGLQIFRVDMASGAVLRASESQGGAQGNDQSRFPAISGDGRRVAFLSFANNLVALDNNNRADIFLKDLDTGTLEVISRDATGAFANDNAAALTAQALSADARYVVFPSLAANMVSGVAGGTQQIYLRDRIAASTSLVSQSASNVPGSSQSDQSAISANGRFVVFRSFAGNLVAGAASRLFVLDRQSGVLAAVPLPLGAAVTPPLSVSATACRGPRVADNGDVVMVCDMATPTPAQAFVWRRASGQLGLLSRDALSATILGNALSGGLVSISSDAQTIAFESQASNLVNGDGNAVADVFYRAPPPDSLFANSFE